jgi:two-component system NtrC family sensor kinase
MPSGLRRGRLRVNLTVKLAAAVVTSFAALMALFSYLSLREHRQHSEQLVLTSADRITDLIQRSTSYQMLHNDREALYHMIRAQGSEQGLRRIRIFNEEGRISYSTDAAEVGKVVDKQAEACYACHAQAKPLTRLDRPDRARIYTEPGGDRVLGMIRPIENEPSCWTAACHAHPRTRRILGVIDANMSLASVDAQLADYRSHLVWLTGLAVLLASMVSVGFILAVVHRPVGELMTGIRKVAAGDLGHRLPVYSNDELGELASSFNKMTQDLARANDEITAWTRTLEERVERKTQELEKAYAGLIASGKLASLGKLAATVAHEVNNPLFGILTYSRLAQKELVRSGAAGGEAGQVFEQLRIIERESRRCGEIVKNLLAFARQQPPQRQPQDLNTLVRRTLTLVRHQLEIQGVEVAERLAGDLPACAADADQIQQVLLVLLMNAAEAMPRGGLLQVTSEWDREANHAVIRVKDNGSGIPSDVLPHIFEPFFTPKEDQHRTGLGLAVARNIVDRHGGTLTAVSTPETGTQFTLSLPIDAPAETGRPHTEITHERT